VGQTKRDTKVVQSPDLLSELVKMGIFCLFFMAGWEHGRKLTGVTASSLPVFPLKPGLMFLFGRLANKLRFSS